MDALILDFDGVVVDSEPTHWRGFAAVLDEVGVALTWDAYRERYLGLDDHDCFAAVLADHGIAAAEKRIAAMIAAKTASVSRQLASAVEALPGAVALIRAAADACIPLAVCSGALRHEIEVAARRVGVWGHLLAIVAAEDVRRGKPDPAGYRQALRRLRAASGRRIAARRSVAIEDSPAGIQAAKTAGLRVLAVTTSYAAPALAAADRTVASLADVTPTSLDALTRARAPTLSG